MTEFSCSPLLPLSDEMDHQQSSQPSMVSSSDNDFEDICRICHSEGQPDSPLISPCYCSGSLCYVHNSCLQEWIKSSDIKCCEICKFQFIMHSKILPFRKWKELKMTLKKKLLLVLSITFYAMVIPLLVRCLLLMAEKEDADQRLLLSSVRAVIWTAKIVIGIGLFFLTFFMVYQCNLCVKIFWKWRNSNRIIYVQNAPKISGTVQEQQQQAVEFSAPYLLSTNELASEGTRWFSPKESKFYNCQRDSTSNIYSSNNYSAQVCDEKNTSGEITTTMTSTTETLLTSDYKLPLSEVLLISTAADDNSRKDNPKTIDDKIHTTENDSRETSLVETTDNALVPGANNKCPHSEAVVSSTTLEPDKGKLKKIICNFFLSSHNKEHAEDKNLLLP